ncbi:hypothetical protein DL93DRAFT_2086068 [Clavulina sp. PMI_390]|nr:hypothetical protein DL93DRAFT_2086068 [Clavulina sp. PMI_390]
MIYPASVLLACFVALLVPRCFLFSRTGFLACFSFPCLKCPPVITLSVVSRSSSLYTNLARSFTRPRPLPLLGTSLNDDSSVGSRLATPPQPQGYISTRLLADCRRARDWEQIGWPTVPQKVKIPILPP